MFSIFFYICLSIFYLCTGISLFNFFFSNFQTSLNTLYIFTCICVKDDYLINLSFYLFIRISQLFFFFNSYTYFNILHMFIHVLSIIFIKNINLSWVFFLFFYNWMWSHLRYKSY